MTDTLYWGVKTEGSDTTLYIGAVDEYATDYDHNGQYQPSVTGTMPNWLTYKSDITKVKVKACAPTTTANWFSEFGNLTSVDVSELNTSNVTNMFQMFDSCGKLTTLDLGNFDTSNVESMNNMFYHCYKLASITLSENFKTSNVTNMHNMFNACNALTSLDLSMFDTSNVTDMGNMFYSCNALTSLDVSGFDTRNVTNMVEMFSYCQALTSLDVSNFVMRNVDANHMFSNCGGLTSLNLSVKAESVTNSNYILYSCSALKKIKFSKSIIEKVGAELFKWGNFGNQFWYGPDGEGGTTEYTSASFSANPLAAGRYYASAADVPTPNATYTYGATSKNLHIIDAFDRANAESNPINPAQDPWAEIRLNEDAEIEETLVAESFFTLDLNGHVLKLKDGVDGSVIKIVGNFNLHDKDAAKTNTVTNPVTSQSVTVQGGVIVGDKGTDGKGGGVLVDGNQMTIFNMIKGTILGGSATDGGGVYVNSGAFFMQDGAITGCEASGNGGGVFVAAGSRFTMTGGKISNNVAGGNGGGVYHDGVVTEFGSNGNRRPEIWGNTVGGSANNLYVANDNTISFNTEQPIKEGAKIGVANDGVFMSGYALNAKPSAFFVSDNAAKPCVYISNTSLGVVSIAAHNIGSMAAEISATCEAAGVKAHKECSQCGECYDAQDNVMTDISIPALGHDWGEWTVTKQPTTDEFGEETRVCKHDGAHKETRQLSKLAPSGNGTNNDTGDKPNGKPDKKLSAGAIAGITIGAVLAASLALYVALYFALYRKGKFGGKAWNAIYAPMNALFKKKAASPAENSEERNPEDREQK